MCLQEVEEGGLALHRFITEELNAALEKYGVGEFRVIIGHSFAASFVLYSYIHAPDHYQAVFAHSPYHDVEGLITQIEERELPLDRIYYSVGGAEQNKDKYHRAAYEKVKAIHPTVFDEMHTWEGNSFAHNSLPIAANPLFLSGLFEDYSSRFVKVAEVDMNYQLIAEPLSVEEEMALIDRIERRNGHYLPLEIPDVNGIASRYMVGEHYDHAIALYEKGAALYPTYFEFHWYLGQLYAEVGELDKALDYLRSTVDLLERFESDMEEQQEYLEEIQSLIKELESAGLEH